MFKIDLENDREIAVLLAWVVYDKHHPLHGRIAESYESSVTTIIELYINKKDYREIILEEFSTKGMRQITDEEIEEQIICRRKEVEVCKKVMKERLLAILRERVGRE